MYRIQCEGTSGSSWNMEFMYFGANSVEIYAYEGVFIKLIRNVH